MSHIETKIRNDVSYMIFFKQNYCQFVEFVEEFKGIIYMTLQAYSHNPTEVNKPRMLINMDRDYFVDYFSWAIPNPTVIKTIVQFCGKDPIVELGCGTGLWSMMLAIDGCCILPVDIVNTKKQQRFVKVENKAIDEILTNDCVANVLFICWPVYDDDLAVNTLQQFTGNKLIYIGEYTGCCANDAFFEEIDKSWKCINQSDSLQSWPGIYDTLTMYERKKQNVNPFEELVIGCEDMKNMIDFGHTVPQTCHNIIDQFQMYMSKSLEFNEPICKFREIDAIYKQFSKFIKPELRKKQVEIEDFLEKNNQDSNWTVVTKKLKKMKL